MTKKIIRSGIRTGSYQKINNEIVKNKKKSQANQTKIKN